MPRVKISGAVKKAVLYRPRRMGREVPIMTQKDAEAIYYALTGKLIRIKKLKCPCSLNDFIIWMKTYKPARNRPVRGKVKARKKPFNPAPGPFTPWSTLSKLMK